MLSYNLSNTIINSMEPLFLLNEIIYSNNPDIQINWYKDLSIDKVTKMFDGYYCSIENMAESSFNDIFPKAKIYGEERLIYYNTQVLFKLINNKTTHSNVVIEVYVCDGFPIGLAKEILLTDALPIAIYMKFSRFFLHAACVSMNDRQIAFLGDGGAGKSTLASFLYFNGYNILSDDMICINVYNDIIYTTSYVNRLRLWNDSFNNISSSYSTMTYNGKHIIDINKTCNDWVKIDACCWLNRGDSKTELRPLTKMEGYIRLISSIIMGFAYKENEIEMINKNIKTLSKSSSLYDFFYCDGYDKLGKIIPLIKEKIL